MGISATLTSPLYSRTLAILIFLLLLVHSLGQNMLSCETRDPEASGYHCNANVSECATYAILHTNSYFSSLTNLSLYLGLNRFMISDANGFSADTEFLPQNQLLLIPIYCKCKGGLFQAEVTKTTIKGESFYGISESLQGLTTCKAIQKNNPVLSPYNLPDKFRLLVPFRCSCPSSFEVNPATRIFVSYPVRAGDTIVNLAVKFNTTIEAIASANNRSSRSFRPTSLVPFTSVLIPVSGKPSLSPLSKRHEPDLRFPVSTVPVINPHKKKSKMWLIGVYIAVTSAVVGITIAVAAAFLVRQFKRKKENLTKDVDPELQQLGLSVRTTSEKKVSTEGSQDPLDGHIIDSTPRNVLMVVESYTMEEMRRATEDFVAHNHIEGTVYYGRLNGKNVAIKQTKSEIISKIDFRLFQDPTTHHPNIIRLLGSCISEGVDSDPLLVFEYATNGSLKDWLHGGLAMKNQFIASCYCFLTWNQRLKICLDVAAGLQFMHHVMNPSYVHRHIKSRNIFLDEDFNAKIGNFGLANCFQPETNEPADVNSTNPESWNIGYLAPEYIHQGKVSPSTDIFAYGVVLLEVLSGQPPITISDTHEKDDLRLTEKIKSLLASENAEDLRQWMDTALGENYSFDGAVTLANLARACIDEDPGLRPSAGEIVEKLSRLVGELPGGDQMLMSESSSKPLVTKTATRVLTE